VAQEYISYIQTEELFKKWPTLQGIRESLERELELYECTSKTGITDDDIYTKIIGNKVLSDSPHSGKLSDTTGDTALNAEQMWDKDMKETKKHLLEEKLYIELVNDKLDIAFKRLSPTQQKILKLFYIENRTWAEVLEQLKRDNYMSKDQAKRRRREAIEKIQSISKITVDMYDYVMKLVEVE